MEELSNVDAFEIPSLKHVISALKIEKEQLHPVMRDLVLILERQGPLTRDDLVKIIGKPRTTIYEQLMDLITHDLAKKYSHPTNSRGRPLVFFKLAEGIR